MTKIEQNQHKCIVCSMFLFIAKHSKQCSHCSLIVHKSCIKKLPETLKYCTAVPDMNMYVVFIEVFKCEKVPMKLAGIERRI